MLRHRKLFLLFLPGVVFDAYAILLGEVLLLAALFTALGAIEHNTEAN